MPKSWLLLLLSLLPLLPRNINFLQSNGGCLQLKGVQMPKYSAAALSKVFLAVPIVWDFLVRLFEKAVSFKNRGLVASEQNPSAFVYGGICTLSFAVFWHLAFVLLLQLNFRLGGKVFYAAQQALVPFIFFSLNRQIKKHPLAELGCLFSTANEDKRFWKDESLCISPCDDLHDLFFAAVQITSLKCAFLQYLYSPLPPSVKVLPLSNEAAVTAVGFAGVASNEERWS